MFLNVLFSNVIALSTGHIEKDDWKADLGVKLLESVDGGIGEEPSKFS